MSERPEILKKEVLWEGKHLRSLLLTYRNSKGRISYWEAFQRVGINGIVAVVPISKDNKIILTKQYRPPLDAYVVEFPAGLNDRREPLEDVALRELREETGYVSDKIAFLMRGPLSSGASTETMDVFVVWDAVDTGVQRLEDLEDIEVIRIPLEGFYDSFFELEQEDTLLDLKVPGLLDIALRKLKGLR